MPDESPPDFRTSSDPSPEAADSLSANRRRFFRQTLLWVMDQTRQVAQETADRLSHAIGPALTGATQSTQMRHSTVRHPGSESHEPKRFLRPPGAKLPFVLADPATTDPTQPGCHLCGQCAAACPAHAIQLNVDGNTLVNDSRPASIPGPFIIADRQPCVLCEGLLCTHVCPSGALQPVTDPAQVKIGMAIVNQSTCRRASGEDCRKCLDPCPLGSAAIGLDGDGRIVVRRGCTGCGLCEQACPDRPASIFVLPAKTSSGRVSVI